MAALPAVVRVPDSGGVDPILEDWTAEGRLVQRVWTDAYLAALAVAGDHTMVICDRDVLRFDLPSLTLLTA